MSNAIATAAYYTIQGGLVAIMGIGVCMAIGSWLGVI